MTSSSSVPRSPVKTLQQLLNEVEQLKVDFQTSRPTTVNDEKDLRDRLSNLQRQINTIRNDANPPQPSAEFDQSKQRALEALSGLFKQLDGRDRKRQQSNRAASLSTSSDDDDSDSDSRTSPPVKPRSPRDGSSSNVQRPVYKGAAKSARKASITSESEEDDESVMYARTEARGSAQIRKGKATSGSSESGDESVKDQDQPIYRDNRSNLRQEVRTSTPIRRKAGQEIHRGGKDAEASTINGDSSSSDGSRYDRSRPVKEKLSRARSTGKKRSGSDDDRAQSPEAEESFDSAGELDKGVHTPGTRFRATHNFQAIQPNDLNFKVNDILILREQRPDRWWLFEHEQTGEQGSVPINHIKLHRTAAASARLPTPTSIIANAWRTTRSIPSGFVASELAPLSQLPEHQIYRTLIPQMSESNLAFADLHWRYETEDIRPVVAEHQIILTIKECVKIPRVDINQLDVLNRCISVCLYDGHRIISNIHSSRPFQLKRLKAQDRTENWSFEDSDNQTFIDEQCQFLIRSDHQGPLYLIIELTQHCRSKATNDVCDIGCGWLKVQLDDVPLPLVGDTKTYDECLNGGHVHETTVPLHSDYPGLETRGISGKIDRYKRARVKFSLAFRENEVNLLYDQLPLTSMIVPINLVLLLAFFRNELAREFSQRIFANGISTMPIDSIFLSTFERFLAQPDLVYIFCYRYRSSKPFNFRRKRSKCLEIYTTYIYPCLCFLPLATYDFHNVDNLVFRRKTIRELVQAQLGRIKNQNSEAAMAALLLHPEFTDQWAPFTVDEVCFSLQKEH